jgi:hypothetical protein
MVLRFPLKGPARSLVYDILPTKPKFRFKEPMAATWSSDHLAIYRNIHLCLAKTNDLSLAIGLTSVDRKVRLMQPWHPFDSYNLMHKQDS